NIASRGDVLITNFATRAYTRLFTTAINLCIPSLDSSFTGHTISPSVACTVVASFPFFASRADAIVSTRVIVFSRYFINLTRLQTSPGDLVPCAVQLLRCNTFYNPVSLDQGAKRS